MILHNYAFFNKYNICTTVYQSSDERPELNDDPFALKIDDFDESLVGNRYVDGKWNIRPEERMVWNEVSNEWYLPEE